MEFHTDLSRYNNQWFNPGGGPVKRMLWYFTNAFVFKKYWLPVSRVKCFLLRCFGAEIGRNVIIKPCVNIKYPWNLQIGDNTWIGEEVWIDCLDTVSIGANCCLSQGAFILCGNHNYKKESFDLIVSPVKIEDGVWLGARSVVCPGVSCGSHAVLSVGSVATSDLEAYKIYGGNPAMILRQRISDEEPSNSQL
jgi:putative colanic acid biosynthesis acetyltransferase WcaF